MSTILQRFTRPFIFGGAAVGIVVGIHAATRKICLYGDLLDIPAAEEHSDITFTRFDTEVIARRLSSDLFYGISPEKSTQFENDPDDGMMSDSIDFFGKKTITLGKDRINEFDINCNLAVIRQHHHKFELVGCGSFIFYLTHKTQPGVRLVPILLLGMYGALGISNVVSQQLSLRRAIKTTSHDGLVAASNHHTDNLNNSWMSTIFLMDDLPISYEKCLINKEINKRTQRYC